MLDKKPTPTHQKPIYFPKELKGKKKIQKKIIYLSLAIILVIIVLVMVVLISIKKPESESKMLSIEETILKEIQMDSSLSEDVLGTYGDINWEDVNFPAEVKEKIETRTPYFLNCIAKICDPSNSCSLMDSEIGKLELEDKKIHSDSVLISSELEEDKTKVIRIFCWGEEENVTESYCGDGNVDPGEECDGINLGGKTCQSLGFGGGNLSCGLNCRFDLSECIVECVPETDNEFCSRYEKECGVFSSQDNCGQIREVDCGNCTPPEICGGNGVANVCGEEGCVPETNETFCLRQGKNCNSFFGLDNCEKVRTVDCGSCTSPEICGGGGVANVCGEEECVPETNETFCSRYGKKCGVFSSQDNCGQIREVDCGSCVSPKTCVNNICVAVCVPETDKEFCSRYKKECGVFSGLDNCKKSRTVDCGTCTSPEICVNNACVKTCQPDCTGKCGGDDGCGGTCQNTCTGGLVCKAPSYKSCGQKSSVESLGRSLIALSRDNGIYLGWRLLPWDDSNIGFNVYRASSANGSFTKINSAPVKTSTNYYQQNVPSGTYYYIVRTVNATGIEGPDSNIAKVKTGTSKEYIAIPMSKRSSTDKARDVFEIMPADLNGDGVMDFILQMGYKNPIINNERIDAIEKQICRDTSLRIEAIISNSDGTWSSAWRVDTGNKGMNCDNWRAFLTAWDLTGDGKAEIITRWGSGGDLAVLNGSDGSLIAVKPWPHWKKDHIYLAIGLLEDVDNDGRADPFIVVESGGYMNSYSLRTAYRLEGNSLVEKKRLDIGAITKNNAWDANHPWVWGIGTHGLIAADLNNDGFDEIVPCGSIFYTDWSGYWIINPGHCDGCFVGDLDPSNPGVEVFMACEGPPEATLVGFKGQKPERIWTFDSKTKHPHHRGFDTGRCGDISVAGYSGMACWGLELDKNSDDKVHGYPIGNTRAFTISGKEITKSYNWPFRMWGKWPVDWNEGDQTGKTLYSPENYFVVGDVVGDSREEYLSYDRNSNSFLIFTNSNTLNSRYVTPLADRGYRSGLAREGNGYPTNRILMKTNQVRRDIVPVL